jgi:AcrR family transcriptional regulator
MLEGHWRTTPTRKADVVEAAEQLPDPGPPSLEPRRSDSRRNRDRVLEAAIQVLSEHPNATVEDVAAAAGLNRSTVYRRFSSREHLLEAVRRRLVEENRALFRETVAREPDFARCMDELFRAAVHLAHKHRLIWRRLVEIGAMPGMDTYEPANAFVTWLEAAQRDGAIRGDVPTEWVVLLWMQLVVAGSTAAERYDIDIDDAARMAADAAASALRPR